MQYSSGGDTGPAVSLEFLGQLLLEHIEHRPRGCDGMTPPMHRPVISNQKYKGQKEHDVGLLCMPQLEPPLPSRSALPCIIKKDNHWLCDF